MKIFKLTATMAACLGVSSAMAFTAGTYTASIAGQNGPVKVEVKTSNDKILSIKVLDQKETEGIGSKAVESLPSSDHS